MGERNSFILNGNAGKWKFGRKTWDNLQLSVKMEGWTVFEMTVQSLNVFEMPVSSRSVLRLLYKAFPSLFGSVDFTKQLFLIMCQLWNLMLS